MSEIENTGKKSPVRYILWGLGAAALVAGGIMGIKYLKSRKEAESDLPEMQPPTLPPFPVEPKGKTNSSQRDTTKTNTGMDRDMVLKQGSRGENVRLLQRALIDQYGANITADGIFGNQTVQALKKAGLPATINYTQFNLLTKSVNVNPGEVAVTLNREVSKRNINGVIAQLQRIKNTNDYTAVNDAYKKIGFVSKTLVTGVLQAFSNPADKDRIAREFSRIGLVHDGEKWMLSGVGQIYRRLKPVRSAVYKRKGIDISIEGKTVLTLVPSPVFHGKKVVGHVPANTRIGTAIGSKNGLTAFTSFRGGIFTIPTKNISYV